MIFKRNNCLTIGSGVVYGEKKSCYIILESIPYVLRTKSTSGFKHAEEIRKMSCEASLNISLVVEFL